ncbi:HPr family phosphocarrier protein [uncultured Alistipes sp.]|jgi:phosphocarrier,  HPr family|uniref:HPr family phosphocarrier protein n=1 Tax=uncultured Alistipes sp. TaxID=538949 RepID=UPI0025E060B8|nr:HPr family phosphocarrier protein [uncultured Alistipes sp.]
MITRKVTIAAPSGMHARPAGELAKLVKTFAPARVTLRTAAKEVNAASILSILSLGLKHGTEVEVYVEGGNEEVALQDIAAFISSIAE